MEKKFDVPHKCPNCGYDLRTLSDILYIIEERGRDVQSLIDDNIRDFEFDSSNLDDALKDVLKFKEVQAFPSAMEKVRSLQNSIDEISFMEFDYDLVQYDDDPDEDEMIRVETKNEFIDSFDKKKFRKEIDELIKELKKTQKRIQRPSFFDLNPNKRKKFFLKDTATRFR